MAARRPITPEREDAFLRAFIESGGSFSDACRAASPHLATDSAGRNPPAHSSWRQHITNNLAFAERFAEAKAEVADELLKIAHRRIGRPSARVRGASTRTTSRIVRARLRTRSSRPF